MIKNLVKTLVLAAFLVMASQSAAAAHTVTFVNQTSYDIDYLRIDDHYPETGDLPLYGEWDGIVISAGGSKRVMFEIKLPYQCVVTIGFEGYDGLLSDYIDNFPSVRVVAFVENDNGIALVVE